MFRSPWRSVNSRTVPPAEAELPLVAPAAGIVVSWLGKLPVVVLLLVIVALPAAATTAVAVEELELVPLVEGEVVATFVDVAVAGAETGIRLLASWLGLLMAAMAGLALIVEEDGLSVVAIVVAEAGSCWW